MQALRPAPGPLSHFNHIPGDLCANCSFSCFPPYLSLLPEALLLKVQAMKTVKDSMDNNGSVDYRNGS